jgi:hypothetical protein
MTRHRGDLLSSAIAARQRRILGVLINIVVLAGLLVFLPSVTELTRLESDH